MIFGNNLEHVIFNIYIFNPFRIYPAQQYKVSVPVCLFQMSSLQLLLHVIYCYVTKYPDLTILNTNIYCDIQIKSVRVTFLGDSGLGLIIKLQFSCWLGIQSFRSSKICFLDHSLGCQQALASHSLWTSSPSSSPHGPLHRVHDGPHDTASAFPRG